MLYIIYDRNFKEGIDREWEWHVGQPVPNIQPHRIIELQADGDEKAHIQNIMGATVNKDVATYYGDLARTIFLNL